MIGLKESAKVDNDNYKQNTTTDDRDDHMHQKIMEQRTLFYANTYPQSIQADNFAYAMLYGMKGKDSKGYPNPEIIQGIIDYLKQ